MAASSPWSAPFDDPPVEAELVSPARSAWAVVPGVEPWESPRGAGPAEMTQAAPGRRAPWLWRLAGGIGSSLEWLFGAAALTGGLALLAAIPVLQLLSLGYLIECSGRVAANGRLRAGFVGVRKAARLGSIVLGCWFWLLPLRYLSSLRTSALLIHPEELTRRQWNLGLGLATALVVLHILGAVWRGGRLRHFFLPELRPWRWWRAVRQGGLYARSRDAVCDFVAQLRLPHYALLGLKGFVGGLVWLGPPVTLIALGRRAPLVGLLGAVGLTWSVGYVSFLQARLGAEGRLGAMFEPRVVRELFRRAPIAYLAALTITLVFALPLHLLKIELIPREATWLPSLVFVTFIFPARLLVGWAAARGARAPRRRWLLVRWPAAWLSLAVAAAYVLVVYFSQFTSWHGIWSLYEQHAFLVPVPFVGQ